MLSAIVILLVAAMAWVWSTQGLFSAFLHLVLTILAGVIGLVFWELMVYGFLINRMPEQAWGVAFLIPFGAALLILRTVFDKMVPNNLNFHNLVDKIGGGILGFISGILTVGMLVIGMQMIGMPDVLGYQAFELTPSGEVQRKQRLIIPVDTMAGGFFSMLSGGSMSPILGSASLPKYHPYLAREASFYHQSPFWTSGLESGRRSLHPKAVSLVEGGYFQLGDAPPSLKEQLQVGGKTLIIVGCEIAVQHTKDATGNDVLGGGDKDGVFRISPQQIELVGDNNIEGVGSHFPVGYIMNGVYNTLQEPSAFAYSGTASTVLHHYIFAVPQGTDPMFLYIKRARTDLRELTPSTDIAKAEGLIQFQAPSVAEMPDEDLPPLPTETQIAVVSPALPFSVNKNRVLGFNVDVRGRAIASGQGTLVRKKDDQFAGPELLVDQFASASTARIVRVNFGRRTPQSLLGQVMNFALQGTQIPLIVTTNGQKIQPCGFTVHTGAQFRFKFDLTNQLRAFSELGNISDEEEVRLYYQVDQGLIVQDIMYGNKKLNPDPLNLKVTENPAPGL